MLWDNNTGRVVVGWARGFMRVEGGTGIARELSLRLRFKWQL